MSCYWPIRGFRKAGGGTVATRSKSLTQAPVVVPCGRCIGCRMARAEDWGTRISLEAQLHDEARSSLSLMTTPIFPRIIPFRSESCSSSLRGYESLFRRLRCVTTPAGSMVISPSGRIITSSSLGFSFLIWKSGARVPPGTIFIGPRLSRLCGASVTLRSVLLRARLARMSRATVSRKSMDLLRRRTIAAHIL